MPIRTNGGVFTDQMLTGSLKHFTIDGADFSGAADANNYPIHGSAAEIVFTEVSQKATIVIMNPITNTSGMSFALETNRADWTAEEIQELVRALGTIGVDNVNVSTVIVEQSSYDLLSSGVLSTTFLTLTDTPTDYTGTGTFFVRVRTDETGLEFVSGGAAAPVSSVFGRTGAVEALADDYSAGQVTYNNVTSGIVSTDVQGAIDTLDNRTDTLENAGFLTNIAGESIGDLSDVDLGSISSGEVLVWDGAGFIAGQSSSVPNSSYLTTAISLTCVIKEKYLVTASSVILSLPLLSSVTAGDAIRVAKIASVASTIVQAAGIDQISSDIGQDTSVDVDLTHDIDFIAGPSSWELMYGGL